MNVGGSMPVSGITRREFLIGTTLGLSLSAAGARAQPSKRMMRVGIVDIVPRTEPERGRAWGEFDKVMRERGWVEGENIVFERRYFRGDFSRLPALMAELVALEVDVIVTITAPATFAARKATDRIPIVFAVGDAVGRGLVASLAQPGGNATGTSAQFVEQQAKRIELLQQLSPGIARVAALMNTDLGFPSAMFHEPRPRGVETFIVEFRGAHDLDRALATIIRERAEAVLLAQIWSGSQFRAQIVEAIARPRLPAIFPVREYVELGGLVSYGVEWGPTLGRTALYVDKILRGAKPGDLPVEQPIALELAINLNTARALGITVPREILLRADRIVE